MTLSLEPFDDLVTLERLWVDLERRADPPFFLSWQWIGCWVRALPADRRPWLLVLRDGPVVVGLALLTPRRTRRLAVIRMGQWWLHETGDPQIDTLTIEDNGILLAPRPTLQATSQPTSPGDLAALSLRWLLANAPGCDELVLGGIGPELEAAVRHAAAEARFAVRPQHETVRPYVDLDAVRAQGGDYLAMLGRNTRQAVRRAMRLYEESGPLRLRIAADPDEAFADFDRLKALHQAYWTGRGKPGAFASPFFERFHRRLISEAFGTGAIQLCRVSAGAREIGYLYNFAWRGWIHAYQSGFVYSDDNRLKPGLVSHSLAIRQALESGRHVYDFMAGDGRHKRSLSTHAIPMAWLALTADRMPWRVEQALRRLKHHFRGHKASRDDGDMLDENRN